MTRGENLDLLNNIYIGNGACKKRCFWKTDISPAPGYINPCVVPHVSLLWSGSSSLIVQDLHFVITSSNQEIYISQHLQLHCNQKYTLPSKHFTIYFHFNFGVTKVSKTTLKCKSPNYMDIFTKAYISSFMIIIANTSMSQLNCYQFNVDKVSDR